jgi:hypothetical protein
MEEKRLPAWVKNIPVEDLSFIREFLLASGSLKAISESYSVSYPTMRIRLDQLIERIRIADDTRIDPFHARLKELVADGALEARLARELLNLHRKHIDSEGEGNDHQ